MQELERALALAHERIAALQAHAKNLQLLEEELKPPVCGEEGACGGPPPPMN